MRIKQDLSTYNASIYLRCKSDKVTRPEQEKNPRVHDSRCEFGPHRHWRRELFMRGWDLADWLECLTANAEVGTVLGSISASLGTVESEGGQMNQCWIQFKGKQYKKPPIDFDASLHHCLHGIAYCQSNRLFILLERAETEIPFWLANGMLKKMDINRHGPRLMPNNCKILDPPYFSLPTIFKNVKIDEIIEK
jgi:hypothetical protein